MLNPKSLPNREGAKPRGSAKDSIIFELDKPLREPLRHRAFAVELNREGAKPRGSAKDFNDF